MKTTKKIAALVLAMVMAFSLMAVTASAYGAEGHERVCGEETVQPRTPSMQCPKCGTIMNIIKIYDIGGKRYVDFECPADGTVVNRIPW